MTSWCLPADDDIFNHSNSIIEGAFPLMPLPPPLLPLLLPLQHLHHMAALAVLSTHNAMLCTTPHMWIGKAHLMTRCCSAVLRDQYICSLACSRIRSCVAVSWRHEINVLTLYTVQWRAAICTAKKPQMLRLLTSQLAVTYKCMWHNCTPVQHLWSLALGWCLAVSAHSSSFVQPPP